MIRTRARRLFWPVACTACTAVLAAAASGCGGAAATSNVTAKPSGIVDLAPSLREDVYPSLKGTVNLAHSPGVLFGTFLVMEQLHVLEKMAPNMDVKWNTINETSQQRDAVLAGKLDFTSCTSFPFIQGWSSGVPWKVVGVTNVWDGELFVKPGKVESISDFIGTQKKVSPGPGTTQEFVTQAYLAKQGKEPTAMASNWTLVPHTDAIQAVGSGQLGGEFATGEYVVGARKAGLKSIFRLSDVNGGVPFASTCAAVSNSYAKSNPAVVKMYADALKTVSEWINDHPSAAAKVMAESTGGQADPSVFEEALSDKDITDFSRRDGHMQEAAKELKDFDVVEKTPKKAADIYAIPGSGGSKW